MRREDKASIYSYAQEVLEDLIEEERDTFSCVCIMVSARELGFADKRESLHTTYAKMFCKTAGDWQYAFWLDNAMENVHCSWAKKSQIMDDWRKTALCFAEAMAATGDL